MQVNLKTQQILDLLKGLEGKLKTYAMLQLSQGFVDLSEGVSSLADICLPAAFLVQSTWKPIVKKYTGR